MDLNTENRDNLIRVLGNVLHDAEDTVAEYWSIESVDGAFYQAIRNLKNSLEELKRTHIE